MDEAFWQARWRKNEIGFHEPDPNEKLMRHFERLGLGAGDTIFLPLCGKSVDIDWFLSHGLKVVGIELSQSAVDAVFSRLGLTPEETLDGPLRRHHSGDLTLFVGDVFALTQLQIGSVTAIYDRAALIALPHEMRTDYARHLVKITGAAPQLLITLNYDQQQMDGPPFAVPEQEIIAHYDTRYAVEMLSTQPITGPIAQRTTGTENAWLLSPRD